MNFLEEIDELPETDEVHFLHLADIMGFIIESDIETQIRLLKLIEHQLELLPITKAEKILPQSYNGLKHHGKTVEIASKRLVIMKYYK